MICNILTLTTIIILLITTVLSYSVTVCGNLTKMKSYINHTDIAYLICYDWRWIIF